MRRLRMSLIAVATLTLLSTATIVAATAQEEGGPPVPEPGQPFAGVLSGSASFEPLEAPTEECPMGVRTITDSAGSTTLGDVVMHAEHCPTFGIPSVPMGQMSLTTDGDDEISGVYFIDCDPVMPTAAAGELITCPGRVLITGGTGLFSDATGSAHMDAFVWFPGSLEEQAWPWMATMHGSIDY
jgi:hypothetical protein